MKIRKGFVSNSSSSSFVIIGNGNFEGTDGAIFDDDNLIIGKIGDTEFGWDEVKYRDMWSRINFAWMLTEYDSRFGDTWKEMLVDVLKEHFGCSGVKSIIDVNLSSYMITDGAVNGYIDHQSTSCESDNGKIFDDVDALKRFLFCEDSYIQGDNDNH